MSYSRINCAMAPGTYVIYVSNTIINVVFAKNWKQAEAWALNKYGAQAMVYETVSAIDITREG